MKNSITFKIDDFRSSRLPSENELISNWIEPRALPKVSILCHTYNQQSYLEDALRGFLIQKTSFPFEVILHDDASTDGTQDIINDYAIKYPRIIKPIIQKENQKSQGHKPSMFSFPHSKGEYIAFCEGDDFWISPNKLSIQMELIEQHTNLKIFCHNAYSMNEGGEYGLYKTADLKSIWSVEDLIESGGEVPTASLVIHRSIFEYMPSWFHTAPVGDFFFQVLGAAAGRGAAFINEPLSVYRINSVGSWSASLKNDYREFFIKMILHLGHLNTYLEYRYEFSINIIESNLMYSYSRYLLADSKFDEARKQVWTSIRKSKKLLFKKLFVFSLSYLKLSFKI